MTCAAAGGVPSGPRTVERLARHLQALIRANTTNPPGNESRAAEYMARVLTEAGVEHLVLESRPGRANVVARLRGRGGEEPLLLLCHLDVVPADPSGWRHDPFAGVCAEGAVWGRGALDCKGLAAIWLEIVRLLRLSGLTLRRDVILAATADEESGGGLGLAWLLEHHRPLIEAGYCLNEGSGYGFRWGDRLYYFYETAEKGLCWLTLRAQGTAGHASMPVADNAVLLLARALAALARQPGIRPGPTVQALVEGLAEGRPEAERRRVLRLLDPEGYSSALEEVPDPFVRLALRAMLGETVVPTVLRAGQRANVIPGVAEADVDCRLLPGTTPEMMQTLVRRRLEEVLGADARRVEVEIRRSSLPNESPPETPLTGALRRALDRNLPGARLVPYVDPGATDARHLRPLGTVVYGFFPTLPGEDRTTIHGVNERITLDSLAWGFRVLWDTVTDFATDGSTGSVEELQDEEDTGHATGDRENGRR